MNYLKNIAIAGTFVAASVASIGSADALVVQNFAGTLLGFGANAEAISSSSGSANPLGSVATDNQPTHLDSVSLGYAVGDPNSLVGFKFVNATASEKTVTVTASYNHPDNASYFKTFWSFDPTGTVPLPGYVVEGDNNPEDLGSITFGAYGLAYLFVQYLGGGDYLGSNAATETLTFVVANGGGGHLTPTVPLPPSMVLFGTGLLGLGFLSARRRRKATSV